MAKSWGKTDTINLGSVQLAETEDGGKEYCACLVLPDTQFPTWIPCSKLTTSGWVQMKDGLLALLQLQEKGHNDKGCITYEELRGLYDLVPYSERRAYLCKYNGGTLAKECCSVCCKHSPPLKKCMYSDCSGLCDTCFVSSEETSPDVCLACEREQKITCSICQDDHNITNTVKSDSCDHRVCWKCYGMAFKAKHPIYNCPLCRSQFTEKEEDFDDTPPLQWVPDDFINDIPLNDIEFDPGLNLSAIEMAGLSEAPI